MERLTVPEVARNLSRNPELIRRWIREGRLRGEKFGRDWLVSEREVERFRRAEPQRRKR
jgi:excisionase family DNA binding protein